MARPRPEGDPMRCFCWSDAPGLPVIHTFYDHFPARHVLGLSDPSDMIDQSITTTKEIKK